MIDLELLTSDGLTRHDLGRMTEIIRGGYGTWFHADLLRALHVLLPHADAANYARLRSAFPGSCAAYLRWSDDADAFAELSR